MPSDPQHNGGSIWAIIDTHGCKLNIKDWKVHPIKYITPPADECITDIWTYIVECYWYFVPFCIYWWSRSHLMTEVVTNEMVFLNACQLIVHFTEYIKILLMVWPVLYDICKQWVRILFFYIHFNMWVLNSFSTNCCPCPGNGIQYWTLIANFPRHELYWKYISDSE